jgi:hypothetical protein
MPASQDFSWTETIQLNFILVKIKQKTSQFTYPFRENLRIDYANSGRLHGRIGHCDAA